MRRCEETNLNTYYRSQDHANGLGMLACTRDDYQALEVCRGKSKSKIGHYSSYVLLGPITGIYLGLYQSQQPDPSNFQSRACSVGNMLGPACPYHVMQRPRRLFFTCLAVCKDYGRSLETSEFIRVRQYKFLLTYAVRTTIENMKLAVVSLSLSL